MNSRLRTGVFILGIVACISLEAAGSKALQYMGRPIDALCFTNLDQDKKSIDLTHCGLKATKYVLNGQNKDLIGQGYTGLNWIDKSGPGNSQGYSYYKFFKANADAFWVYTVSNSGGNGEFTQLLKVQPGQSDTLQVETIMEGDRCNGGISKVKLQDSKLDFSVNVTAFDIIALSKNHDPSLKAYDDLAACAVCCFGKAHYELKGSKPQLKYIDLGGITNSKDRPDQGRYQSCLNDLLTSRVINGHNKLNLAQLDELVSQFSKQCQKHKAN
ncbi:MAG: hypothetical protein H0U75_04975 [Legionella sp.]|nr:hypothetical protein [Legionella sp.]